VKKLILLIVVALLVAACGGGSDPTPTPAPAATEVPAEVAPTEAPAEVAPTEAPAEVAPTEAPAAEAPAAGSAQEAIAQVLEVAMHDIYYGENPDNLTNPPEWTVPAGAEVTVNMQNMGALEHDFAVVQMGAELPVPFLEENRDLLIFEAGKLAGGQNGTATFTAPTEPGIYTVICSIAGHYPVMQGRLVVE
jgi:uncharacterized cupredoxin-like copper-binding protein